MRAARATPALIAALLLAAPLAAQPAKPGAGIAMPAACQELIPPSATRPELSESFPARTFAGYATDLVVTITHGKGETVLPEGFHVRSGSDAAKALAFYGFSVPEPDGGVGTQLETETSGGTATTRLRIPFVPLPGLPGEATMELPAVPITVARASGEIMTLCTSPHRIQVDEPVVNLQNPRPAPNPDPRAQREEWLAAKQALALALLLTVLAVVLYFLVRREMRKPKSERSAPARLPWLVALDELAALRAGSLLAEGRKAELYDRASDCVRGYLGARYGVVGLEATSDELTSLLRRVRPAVPELSTIATFLADCDMVKFARLEPSEAECRAALDRSEAIVRATIPPQHQPAGAPAAPGAPPPGAAPSGPVSMPPSAVPDPFAAPVAPAAPATPPPALGGAVPVELGAPTGDAAVAGAQPSTSTPSLDTTEGSR